MKPLLTRRFPGGFNRSAANVQNTIRGTAGVGYLNRYIPVTPIRPQEFIVPVPKLNVVNGPSITFSGTGNVQIVGARINAASITESGTGALSVTNATVKIQTVTRSGTGVVQLGICTIKSGSVTYSGRGAEVLAGATVQTLLDTLSGAGVLSLLGSKVSAKLITDSGLGSLNFAGAKLLAQTVARSGTGQLSPGQAIISMQNSTLSGRGQMPLQGARVNIALKTLSGQGVLNLAGAKILDKAITFSGTGILLDTGFGIVITGTGLLQPKGSAIKAANIIFRGASNLNLGAASLLPSIANLHGQGQISLLGVKVQGLLHTYSGSGVVTVQSVVLLIPTLAPHIKVILSISVPDAQPAPILVGNDAPTMQPKPQIVSVLV